MYKNIILQTKRFPFNKGEVPAESFLEKEIWILSHMAENIYVLAYDAEPESSVTVELPKNVKSYALKCYKANKPKLIVRGLKHLSNIEINDEHIEPYRLDKLLFLVYCMGKSEMKFEALTNSLFWADFCHGDTLIYNFWFFDFARTALLLRNALYDIGKHAVIHCVSRAHGYDLYPYTNWMNYLPLRPFLLNELDYVFPCSNNGSAYLQTQYPTYRKKIHTMYLGTEDFGQQKKMDGHVFTILSCSRLVPLKRVERIIDALKILADRNIRCHWIHCGGGTQWKQISVYAEKLLRDTSVSYELTGTLTNDEVIALYQRIYADCFVNVSTNEGLPISIMEAISFGIPVIATNVGGSSEIVDDGVNGYLISKNFKDEELADLLMRFAFAPEESYRIEARKKWEKNFQCRENTRRMMKFISSAQATKILD